MKLYNTLTRSVAPLQPLAAPTVTVYTCGPTVYDYAHIGHWFTYIRWDLLIRTLQASGLEPHWVMNITDVGHLVSDADDGEDKLEKGARREGKTAWEVAEFYTADFLREMQSLNIQTPTYLTKATEHITEQIELVQQLETKGFTYVIDDGVYFDTSKFPRYHEFARLDIEEQQAGKRVGFNQQKRGSTDFALWKFSPKNQQRDMEWDSPWSPPGEPAGSRKGFPGWHIECSAMSMKYLGETLDIHTGGIDHIPVHHTNEIAQSEAVTGKPFANTWLHSNHVLIDGEKISKSLGNGIRLHDITEKGISLDAFRLHVLESHYRSQSKFSWESLQAAQNRLNDLRAMAALQWQPASAAGGTTIVIEHVADTLLENLQNDLNTPQALALLSDVSKQLQATLITSEHVGAFQAMLERIDAMLGLHLASTPAINTEQQQLIGRREAARTAKDWTASDALRDQLLKTGVAIRDTAHGAIWYWI